LAEIIEYIKGDKLTLDVMEHHGLTFKDFDDWLKNLVLSGGGQVARGTYVPAMAFLMPATMDFIATTLQRKDWDQHNKWLFISSTMVEFVAGGDGVFGSFFGDLK
jgi:phage pi2 protein 07